MLLRQKFFTLTKEHYHYSSVYNKHLLQQTKVLVSVEIICFVSQKKKIVKNPTNLLPKTLAISSWHYMSTFPRALAVLQLSCRCSATWKVYWIHDPWATIAKQYSRCKIIVYMWQHFWGFSLKSQCLATASALCATIITVLHECTHAWWYSTKVMLWPEYCFLQMLTWVLPSNKTTVVVTKNTAKLIKWWENNTTSWKFTEQETCKKSTF